MPRFPGMDPFLEVQEWEDFHTRYAVVLSELLVPQLGDSYVALVEKRVYVERNPDSPSLRVQPDLSLLAEKMRKPVPAALAGETRRPLMVAMPRPLEFRERFIVIRDRRSREVVTVIEILSPSNKRRESEGRRQYLEKRDAVMESQSHLVELDLLRGGERMPMGENLPDHDYYALVSRAASRPMAEVWVWMLPERMPTINIPLSGDDPDVFLDLQAAFDTVYERASYRIDIDYASPLQPPINAEQREWLDRILSASV